MGNIQYLKAKPRSFSPGDKVLLFLPTPGSPLKCKFTGPYLVSHKLSNLNYVVDTPDRRKNSQLVHVNIIKPYVDRQPEEDSAEDRTVLPVLTSTTPSHPNSRTVTCETENFVSEEPNIPQPLGNPTNSEILKHLPAYLSSLSPTQKDDLKGLLFAYPRVTTNLPGFCSVLSHDITLISKEVKPIKQPAYRLNPFKKEIMRKEVDFLLSHNLAEPSISPWASPCLLIPKPDGSHRFCTDYRKVNLVTVPDSYPLPLIDDLVENIGQAKFISTIDLQKGYYQIGLSDRAKTISAFVTPFGLYNYTVMPFGMINAPATFQRIINYTIQDLEGTSAYLDDLVVVSDSWSDHLARLKAVLDRLQEAGFTINLAKSSFGRATVVYLGHVVGNGMVRPKDANVEAILAFPVPTTRKALLRFLGMAGFYQRFCTNLSSIVAPLTDLTSPKNLYVWTSECDQAFQRLKLFLSSKPVLRNPDYSLPFSLQTDASGVGVGAVLLQNDPTTDILHPVSYFSAKLKRHQQSYSTIEKEALSLVLAIRRFDCYLHQHPEPITVYTDHNPLIFLSRMQNTNQRILRWALQVQPYNLIIRHIKGVDNLLADTLSREPSSTQE